ncbi:LysR substrate-binding domain-containing protein [Roseibium sp. HPY-6]|uniref:LysR substrate-binding domain-containing protein n=1 Tax=Roseibium sp. HPY-6 TaxID=3229852 RepID=UPI00338D6114
MPQRPYELPPLNALVSFEAAARHVSFKSAATELNVTPAAVSHQVKALEQHLNCVLFRRHHRGVELTETGAYLFVSLQRGFEEISDALGQLRARASKTSVTVRATTAMSALWLTPRLAQFWKSHPRISVSQIVSDTGSDSSDCDISIHYGDMSGETGFCRSLFHDRIFALGSPRFARQNKIDSVEDLAGLPLIHLDSAGTDWTDWQDWFSALGFHGSLRNSHRVNNYVIALQAAQDDMGAVLGWDGLTRSFVESGRLVELVPEAVPSPRDYYVKLHPRASEQARLVFDWLAASSNRGDRKTVGNEPG